MGSAGIKNRQTPAAMDEMLELCDEGSKWRFHVRPDTSDADIVFEVFGCPYYRLACSMLDSTSFVVDVGGHIGAFSVLAAAHGARVLAAEPVPDNANLFRRNVEANGLADRIELLEAAVWPAGGSMDLQVSQQNTGGSSLCYGRSDDTSVTVRCVELGTLLDQAGAEHCALLKLDCEGGEFDILSALTRDVWQRIDALVMEYHTLSGPDRSVEQLVHVLRKHGFSVAVHVSEIQGLGYIYATRALVSLPLQPLQQLAVDTSRSDGGGPLAWLQSLLARPFHQLVVFYLNRFVASHNRNQERLMVQMQLLLDTVRRCSQEEGGKMDRGVDGDGENPVSSGRRTCDR